LDEDTDEEYNVKFTKEEIELIHGKFMQKMVNQDLFNLEHDQSQTVPAYVLEAWIVDNPKKDKAYSTFGIEVPEGTLMVTAQVTDKEYYAELVAQEQIGFSIEGYLGMKLKEQPNKINMNKLPDGEHLIDGKIYVVVDGEITEIRDAEVVEASEEVALEETIVEEEVEEETMAVDPVVDAEAITAIVKPLLDEHMNAVAAMIAEMRNQLDEILSTEMEDEEVVEDVALSAHQRLSNFVKFNTTK
jgi:hypothetical protein